MSSTSSARLGYMFFCFNDTATTEIYTDGDTLSLRAALPLWPSGACRVRLRAGAQEQQGGESREAQAGRDQQRRSHPMRFQDQSEQERRGGRSEEHTSELQSLMRNSYAVFCLKKKNQKQQHTKRA